MFDQDDDEYQIQEEYERCVEDSKKQEQAQYGGLFGENDLYANGDTPIVQGGEKMNVG